MKPSKYFFREIHSCKDVVFLRTSSSAAVIYSKAEQLGLMAVYEKGESCLCLPDTSTHPKHYLNGTPGADRLHTLLKPTLNSR